MIKETIETKRIDGNGMGPMTAVLENRAVASSASRSPTSCSQAHTHLPYVISEIEVFLNINTAVRAAFVIC